MKAVLFEKYGTTDDLRLGEAEKPKPKAREVLVKIRATSVNSWDWDLLKGTMWVNRMMFGLRKPRILALGCDIAGVVTEVGDQVERLKVGDEVFGDISGGAWGGFAEYTCAQEKMLATKSKDITFQQAAAIPQAALLALQGVRDKRKLQPGQQVIIDGAGGGVGTFAIQFAKLFGAEVTAVDSRDKFDLMKSLGADHLIDYQQQDFTQLDDRYDMIVGVVGYHSMFDYKRVLKPGGTYAMLGASVPVLLQTIFLGPLISLFGSKSLGPVGLKPNIDDLDYVQKLVIEGKVTPILDKQFPLEQAAEAIQHLGDNKTLGKVVVNILSG